MPGRSPTGLALSRWVRLSGIWAHGLASGDHRQHPALREEVELVAFAQQVGASPHKQIVLVLDRAGGRSSVRLRVPEHLWPLTKSALVNQHFASIEALEDAQAERCVALQARSDLIRSTTLSHWWPKRIGKRQGPRAVSRTDRPSLPSRHIARD
jgi:hypothetical protein